MLSVNVKKMANHFCIVVQNQMIVFKEFLNDCIMIDIYIYASVYVWIYVYVYIYIYFIYIQDQTIKFTNSF